MVFLDVLIYNIAAYFYEFCIYLYILLLIQLRLSFQSVNQGADIYQRPGVNCELRAFGG